MQLIRGGEAEPALHIAEPLEHGLTMAAVIMVAGAFMRYILDDARLSRRYLQVGLATTAVCFFGTWWWWNGYATANSGAKFNQTWGGVFFYVVTAFFAAAAIVLLSRRRGWLRNVVSVALSFYVVNGILRYVNLVTDRAHAYWICPVCNSLYILAIPLLGYVYIREQSIEKRQAEEALAAHREHLEDLVEERTTELTATNQQLQREIVERKQAEAEIAWRNSKLATQNAIAATISHSLDLNTILDTALDTVLAVLELDAGCIFLLEADGETLTLKTERGRLMPSEVVESGEQLCSCLGVSRRCAAEAKPIVLSVKDYPAECRSPHVVAEGFQTLISTPLISKDQAVGTLTLGAQRPNAMPEQELDMLTAIGQQIGMAVENARLYWETERWAHELALLHEASVFLTATLDPLTIYRQLTEQAAKLLGCQAAILFRLETEFQNAVGVVGYGLNGEEIEDLRLQSNESGLIQELVTRQLSVAIEDGRADPRIPTQWREQFKIQALLCLPLLGRDRPLGLLFLIDQQEPRRWRPNEVAWAESFANSAAIALEKALLYEQAELLATLEERQRIAAEMHDGLAQTLSYLSLKAYHASELLDQRQLDAVSEQHAVIQKTIELASKQVRKSISSLQERPQPRRPLQVRLAEVVSEYARNGGSPADLVSTVSDPLFVPSPQMEQVSRIVQEALLNAGRHAQAERVTVYLERRADEVTIIVEDDGQGFDPEDPPQDGRSHFGLTIMRARAARIGGQLRIKSAVRQGTRLSLTWSLGSQAVDGQKNRGQELPRPLIPELPAGPP
jgi:signal transduction histidine kinase